MTRRYRINSQGQETPVWASKASITLLGMQEGLDAARSGRHPIHYGNTTYDTAARSAYETEILRLASFRK
jgi:hypothetical protein